jgi:hypothetical protein
LFLHGHDYLIFLHFLEFFAPFPCTWSHACHFALLVIWQIFPNKEIILCKL